MRPDEDASGWPASANAATIQSRPVARRRHVTAPVLSSVRIRITAVGRHRSAIGGHAGIGQAVAEQRQRGFDQIHRFAKQGDLPGGGGFTRSVCVDELKFNADGSIPPFDMTKEGVAAVAHWLPFYPAVHLSRMLTTGRFQEDLLVMVAYLVIVPWPLGYFAVKCMVPKLIK